MHSRVLILGTAFTAVAFCGCNKQQGVDAANSLGQSYLTAQRDANIRNWQRRVSDTPTCAAFKERFKAAGERYDSNANAQFHQDMMKVMDATKSAGCEYRP